MRLALHHPQKHQFGILWHIIGFVRSIGSTERLHQALFFSAMIGVESLILNQGIKRMFRRTRPTERGDDRFTLRLGAMDYRVFWENK